eukprot:222971_1
MALTKQELLAIEPQFIHIVFGFTRQVQGLLVNNVIIPQEIIYICLGYYYFKYDGKFMLTNASDDVKIISPRKIELGDMGSARLNEALPNDRKTTWKIRFMDGRNGTGLYYSVHYFYGVVSQNCQTFTATAYDGLIDAFGISGFTEAHMFNGKGYYESYIRTTESKVHFQDIMTMEYDPFQSLLVFILNGKEEYYRIVLPIDKKYEKWYPAVSWQSNADYCEVLYG